MEIESWMVARSWGEGRMGSYCSIDIKFQFGKMKKFWRWMVVMAAPQCECTYCLPLWTECLCPSKFIHWSLIPNTMVFGGGTFGRELDHESRALMNGITALLKWDMKEIWLLSLPHKDTARRQHSTSHEVGPHETLDLPSQTEELWHINVCCLSHPVYGHFYYSSLWHQWTYI